MTFLAPGIDAPVPQTTPFVYDNQIGSGDTANPTTAIAGGSIKIHKG